MGPPEDVSLLGAGWEHALLTSSQGVLLPRTPL